MTNPNEEKQKVLALLGSLVHMKKRPGLYLSNNHAVSFWRGFYVACNAFGIDISYDSAVLREKGWSESERIEKQMHDKGMTEEQITEAFIDLVLLSAARRYNLSASDLDRVDRSLRDLSGH